MANSDDGLYQLLDLLKEHPDLIKELVLDSTAITSLLESEEARTLACGQDVQTFLLYVGGPKDGFPILQCQKGTNSICAKGTGAQLACLGNTGKPGSK